MIPMHRQGDPSARAPPDSDVHARLMPLDIDTGPVLEKSLWARRGITLLTVDPYLTQGPEAPKRGVDAPPPRWRSKEFLVYFVALALIPPYMIYVPIRLSDAQKNPNYGEYARMLEPGWMNGRLRDDSDYQYRLFRDYLPMIFALILAYTLCSHAVSGVANIVQCNATQRRIVRKWFLGIASGVVIAALHGTNSLKLVAIALGNYALVHIGTKHLPRQATSALVWLYNCGVLFLVFYLEGVPYERISPALAPLDNYRGLLERWYISYNFSMLRHISYALDYLWALGCENEPTTELAPGVPDARTRVRQHRPLAEYSLKEYLLYLFYPPLFIAGPILTFNDFAAQLARPLPVRAVRFFFYAVRCALLLLAMEFMLHYMYVNAIKNAHAWANNTAMELSMIGFWNLMFVWLKLLLPWRIFRLWALLDGVDPPENMIRAMFNNYSVMGFWRSWHRSYNQWVVRYIYIPVGGSRNVLPSALLVFTFVALWHDLSFTLLAWAWLVTFFIAPEVFATYLLPRSTYGERPWYRHACALGGALNVLMMITANLVGFVVGLDGVTYLWSELAGSSAGIVFLIQAVATLFIGVQLMYVALLTQVRVPRRRAASEH